MSETRAIKNKAQGKLREVKGAATGDMGEELKGKMQGIKGDAQHGVAQSRRNQTRMTRGRGAHTSRTTI